MRIFTYPNPFEINKNDELWNVVTKHPHFCASDTLVQGLETEYGRKSFGILRTITALMNRTLGDYTNNPQNDIQIFLTVSTIIRELTESNIKTSFRFNIADVVESVKFLIMLECDITKFNCNELSEEQNILLDIYKKVMESECLELFKNLALLSKEDFITAARCTLNDEIEYMCNRNNEYKTELDIRIPLKTPRYGHSAILKIIDHLTLKVQETPSNGLSAIGYTDDLEKAKYILSLIKNEDNSIFEKVIIHGVHKITPEMYFFFKLLDKINVEVVFLINYARNLPNIYQTWKEVYSWCDSEFEYVADVDLKHKSNLGVEIANIIEGRKSTSKLTEQITIFNNLTSFTDREVRPTFKKANENINEMRTQYYAVRGESSNEILKMYFPDQFKQKPFLSYPIGQFILGIYQMWDFEGNVLKLNDKSLCECAVSQLFKGNGILNIFEILNKIKLYFSDIETINDYKLRIKSLDTALNIVFRNIRYSPLKKLSFFSITLEELKELKAFLEFIETIANKLFKNVSPTVDFGKHFKTLVEIISIPTMNNDVLSKTEQSLINEIAEKLNVCNDGEVTGSIKDVKEALYFYLAASKKGDTSNWIVRDFEQIDGAVLLRKTSKAHYYHFALLSNAHMTNQNDEVLSWPLTNEMFMGYKNAESAIPVITKGLLERRNFLKFSLFYGSFFTKCKIKLSFISEENGEKQSPYYLLDILNLTSNLYKEKATTSFIIDEEENKTSDNIFSCESLGQEEKEFFSICPYKYLQNVVMKSPIEYYSDYHIKYFVANFMYSFIKGNYNLKLVSIEQSIRLEFDAIEKLFPFWEKIVFLDIEKNTKSQLNYYIEILDTNKPANPYKDFEYERRKENFLIAQWTDNKTGQKFMNFNKKEIGETIENYMMSNQLYPNRSELPHNKVCCNCNYSEVCLRDYYEARTTLEGDEQAR